MFIINHRPRDCLLNRLFRRSSKKTTKLLVTGPCEGNSQVTGEFTAQKASNAENVYIWWRHHVIEIHIDDAWTRVANCLCTHKLYWYFGGVPGLPLGWRHNDHAGVSNHQPHGCLLNRLFRRKSKQTSKLRVTGLCAGNSPGTGEFPAQMASYAENVSIWWRHHAMQQRKNTPPKYPMSA